MSATNIVIQALLAAPGVTGIVGQRINPLSLPQGEALPAIIVYPVSETDEQMLSGAARYYEGRVTVDCQSVSSGQVDQLGEAVKAALEDKTNQSFAGKVATILKQGSDFAEYNDERSLARRVIDFTVRWR